MYLEADYFFLKNGILHLYQTNRIMNIGVII